MRNGMFLKFHPLIIPPESVRHKDNGTPARQ